jgi:sporulation protein YunB
LNACKKEAKQYLVLSFSLTFSHTIYTGGIPMRLHYSRIRLPRAFLARLAVATVVLLILGVVLFMIVERNMSPVIIDMAESRVRAATVKAMNDAVHTTMGNPLQYTDLIRITQGSDGKIMMIQADTVKMNDIAMNTALTTQQNITDEGRQGVGVPIGSVLGGELLAGRGPEVYARIIPVGAVTTDFESEFQNEGINQTRHKIYLNIHVTVRIVIPTKSREINVDTKVLVTECIIIGEVPESYVNVSDLSDLNGLNLLPRVSVPP